MSLPPVNGNSQELPSSGRSNVPASVILWVVGSFVFGGGMAILLGLEHQGPLSIGACMMYAGGALLAISLLTHYCSHRARKKAQESRSEEPKPVAKQTQSRPFEITT